MDITALEDEVFARYARHCKVCEEGNALPDGCPDPKRYSFAPFRAVFVLKEAYGDPLDLRQFIRDGGQYKTWGNLALWSALMINPKFRITDLNVNDSRERSEALAHCAFVNLKKIPGGTTSDRKEIANFAQQHASFLRAQFALYNPEVTITCGTFEPLREIYGATRQPKPKIKDGLYYFRTAQLGIAIDFYHPQYFKISRTTYLAMLKRNLRYHFPERFR